MATQDFKRRLTAIFSADVEGYSRLMREDEEATVRTITNYRAAMAKLIQQYRGRVVDSPGDNILAEFTSVVDGVNCAVEIQRELAERNAELPIERKMQFRIGVNLGDVIEEGERIYGDGVNIAARVEGLAEGGGICISGTVYDAIEAKLGLEYEYLGEQEVKNIDKPVRAYRVLSFPGAAAHRVIKAKRAVGRTWRNIFVAIAATLVVGAAVATWQFYFRAPSMEVASTEKMAFPLPDRPSIAVLPFTNLSGDPEQDYFSDGLTVDIITALSKIPHLFVIARNSMFTYKGKPVNVKQVAEEMGVRYVLEGSVRTAEERVRITAQLIDALRGDHLWAERYDRALEDVFALQDEITMNILTALQVKLTQGEKIRVLLRSTDNLNAYQKYLKGRVHFLRFNRDDNAIARQLFEEAIASDSEFISAYVDLAWTHLVDIHLGVSKSPKESLGRAAQLAQRAISLDETSPFALSLLGSILAVKRQFEEAIAHGEKAVALSPNDSLAIALLGRNLAFAGRYEEALARFEKAIRLDPIPLNWYLNYVGHCYLYMGRYEEALEEFQKVLHRNPKDLTARVRLVAAYSLLGRKEDASVEAAELLRRNPKFSIESIAKWPYKNKADRDFMMIALRNAGLPDKPPMPLPDKPSIAVLAFDNLSGDPEQEYLADGISENIISALSKISELFVIARHSTFTYKGKPVKVQQVSRELGVRYVLEGSVQRAGDRLRITAQLIDATTGNHLWSERYDRNRKDIFALQDEITLKILAALQVKLTHGKQARMWAKGTENLDAYLKLMQAREYYLQMNIESNALARQLAEEAIALDPEYGDAYSWLGATHMQDVWFQSSKSPKASIVKAMELLQKALALDDSLAFARSELGLVYTVLRQHDKGIAEAERAVALNPNSADAYNHLGLVLRFAGRPEEAIPALKKAIRLNPFPPGVYFYHLATASAYAGQCEEAIAACEKALQSESDNLLTHITTTVSYSLCGKDEEARETAAGVLRINPKFSTKYFAKKIPYKNQADIDRYISALRTAGLK